MLLATRCPHCETVFRLQQEQLSLHEGLVRCGHCEQIFNASQSLVPEFVQQSGPVPAEPTLTESARAEPPLTERPTQIESTQAEHATHPAPTAAEAAVPEPEPRANHAPQRPASRPRLFTDDTPAQLPSRADYKPEGWDMFAPWLDGGVDPSLEHNGRTVRTTPLVPLPAPTTHAGVVRLAGTSVSSTAAASQPDPVDSADAPVDGSATSPAAADEPVLRAAATPSVAPPPSADDPREPRFVAHVPDLDADRDAETGRDDAARVESSDSDRYAAADASEAPREPRFARGAEPAATSHASTPAANAGDTDDAEAVAAPPASTAGASSSPFPAALSDDDRPHFAVTREARVTPRRGMLGGFFGGLVAAALAVLLVAQLAWWQRESLMIYWPITQSWFRHACAPLGCTVAPPRAIDGLRLDATDLRQLDGPRVLELKVPLTNRYRVALAYPSLELTLLDDASRVTARRVLAPRDYVRPGMPIDAGLAAGTTQTMIVRVETNGAPASNFRVQIFYP
ncbi:zinc-ribbon domain-containing protein [Burkholderia dolosa]|uniref:Zinc-ribbon domain-containing protein n=1 Tax=Burkholderia dolosa TaxID=152500 RepID=A0A892I5N3_9BURK|nr:MULTISPECIES: zinc-ribbon and DUF3426 domain-containing protein [Burkholderia]AKE04645.1 hypothetical protein XM57_17920 [Burkholderia cepacia]AJY14194.1 family finger-like domain protein [Burkholderia dolosa AU0158]AYZ96592.1 DUF3426 domain-containing protein [Burkholderia dolosa]ETP66466.1 hypothetical protein BDSB_14530 [Burkholderia dolosa PC543]MBR8417538.1 zinc-ribbon domain-containing protein [Burkholderia dolosa]